MKQFPNSLTWLEGPTLALTAWVDFWLCNSDLLLNVTLFLPQITPLVPLEQVLFCTAFIVLIFSVLTIAKEGVVMYQQVSSRGAKCFSCPIANSRKFHLILFQRKKYARDVVNVVGWVLNVSSILTSIIILCPNFVDPASANIIAATAVFSAWFNYLLYLQRWRWNFFPFTNCN